MKKLSIYIAVSLVMFSVFVVPAVSFAQNQSQGLIPCGRSPGPGVDEDTTHPCTFKDVMTLINTLIDFTFKYLAVPIAAIMFAYAGLTMIMAGGAEGKTKAKNIFTNAAVGLILAAAAWLIIKTLLSILGYDGVWIGF